MDTRNSSLPILGGDDRPAWTGAASNPMTGDTHNKDIVGAPWHDVLQAVPPATRALVAEVVGGQAQRLADLFYEAMMAHPAAGAMLDHATVNHRLRASMQRWLRQLFCPELDVEAAQAVQRRTGEVHARVGVGMDLIACGALVLKRAIAESLAGAGLPARALPKAIQYVYELVDVAVGAMNMAYEADSRRIERSDEAYRLMFMGRDLRAERERQRSQLLEWAQQILVRYYWDASAAAPSGATGFEVSPFGLWVKHKASVLFGDAPELGPIRQAIDDIEHRLLPQLGRHRAEPDAARTTVVEIHNHIEQIKALLGTMFDRFIESQDGHDGVTRLLSRRFLPAIARREIELAQRQAGRFALLLVDIDHFARLRAAPGPETADTVLSQVADALLEHVRAGDFVFRVGDDRFCILLVETHRANLLQVADGLREHIGSLHLNARTHLATQLTVSIGVAAHDGHPDYQRLLDRGEDALRQAKAGGRNRCVLAA